MFKDKFPAQGQPSSTENRRVSDAVQESQSSEPTSLRDNNILSESKGIDHLPGRVGTRHEMRDDGELALLREVIDSVETGTLVVERGGRVLCGNASAAAALGVDSPGLLTCNLSRDTNDEYRADQWRRLLEWLDQGNSGLCELVFGGRRWVVGVSALSAGEILIRLEKSPELSESSRRYLRSHYRLTPAELTVLNGLLTGQPPRQIADEKGVAESTVRTQIKHALSKTRTRSISELILKVCRHPVG